MSAPRNDARVLSGSGYGEAVNTKGVKSISIHGFRTTTTASDVRSFLEDQTGPGTVYALKVRPPKVIKSRSLATAYVQFTESCHATRIKNMEQAGSLIYLSIPLRVRGMEHDIVPRPRVQMFELDHATLHIGSLIGVDTLSVLWSIDVKFSFGINMREICFFLSHDDCSYKLVFSYGSIWEIQLQRSSHLPTKFLLFLVQAAPKIYYQNSPCASALLFESPIYNFFKDSSNDQWSRTTDFTPKSCIGQSSTLCLEIPHNCKLPNIGHYFVYYKEVDKIFSLVQGSTYCHGLAQNYCGLDLVPVVQSRLDDIPYKIIFKVNHLVQNGVLSGPTIDGNFFRLVNPLSWPINFIERALEDLTYSRDICYDPVKWLLHRYSRYKKSNHPPESTTITLDPGLVYVHRVQITPCKVYFCGPEINVSNRVLRRFPEDLDNFLRISFVDEDCDKMRSTDLSVRGTPESHSAIYRRILSILKRGIVIGNKKFEFLAFSASQLRENSAWMFASRMGLSATNIREDMGDFRKIRNVAKYAARLGQSFSSSTETLKVPRDEVDIIPDIENSAGYVFSDGIGKISPEFARKIAIKCNVKSSTPSAFQIRYGGYKGVVAVDLTSTIKLSLRNSMCKFDSNNTSLDILAYSKYQPCFLNRQIITLLSTLGVRDHIFEQKQEEAVEQLDALLTDPKRAEEALEIMSPGETTNVLKELLSCGYKPDKEPFLSSLLQTFRATKLLELRKKTRIFVPKGRSMMGCLDETRTLEYGQVFVQVSSVRKKQFQENGLYQHRVVVTGKVVVAKNPCLHPGDVRILEAVDIPYLHHMVDCIVFPQKGERPHPNECSGSDLDGDIYFVTWDHDLIPSRQLCPMEYTSAPTKTLDHDTTIEEVEEYFTNYMVNDSLGIIANAHTVLADKEPLKAESLPCIELAGLFSIAVDFPKTGVPAVIPRNLQVKEYPDFMEKLDKPTYVSKGIIGKLFRAVKDLAPHASYIKAFTEEVAAQSYDSDMEVDGYEEYLDEASWFKGEYDFKLGNLMDHYEIKTEAEILSGNIMKSSKTFNKYKEGEAIGHAIKSLRKEVRIWFKKKSCSTHDYGEDDLDAKASACYYVTYHPEYWGCYNQGLKRPHFISFPWCIHDRLIQIKTEKVTMRKAAAADLQSLRRHMAKTFTLR